MKNHWLSLFWTVWVVQSFGLWKRDSRRQNLIWINCLRLVPIPDWRFRHGCWTAGRPDGQFRGGHTNIGAGRVVYQELTRITKSISDGDFFQNEALCGAVENCKKNGTALHLMGLCLTAASIPHNKHLYGLLELAKRAGLEKVYVHCFMDGRDVPPTSGKGVYRGALAKNKGDWRW